MKAAALCGTNTCCAAIRCVVAARGASDPYKSLMVRYRPTLFRCITVLTWRMVTMIRYRPTLSPVYHGTDMSYGPNDLLSPYCMPGTDIVLDGGTDIAYGAIAVRCPVLKWCMMVSDVRY
eukprot:3041700-Rhodomonas_salina.3